VRAEFVERSADAALATISATPYLYHVPVMTGGVGVRKFAPFTQNGSFAKGMWLRRFLDLQERVLEADYAATRAFVARMESLTAR
jgi:hypothetical protein